PHEPTSAGNRGFPATRPAPGNLSQIQPTTGIWAGLPHQSSKEWGSRYSGYAPYLRSAGRYEYGPTQYSPPEERHWPGKRPGYRWRYPARIHWCWLPPWSNVQSQYWAGLAPTVPATSGPGDTVLRNGRQWPVAELAASPFRSAQPGSTARPEDE